MATLSFPASPAGRPSSGPAACPLGASSRSGAAERAKEHQGVTGELPSAVAPPSGCRLRTRCPRAADLSATAEPPLRPFTTAGHHAACHFPLREPEEQAPLPESSTAPP